MVAEGFTALKFDADAIGVSGRPDPYTRTVSSAQMTRILKTLEAIRDTIGFDVDEARFYCEAMADSYQIFEQDRVLYMSRCVSSFSDSPPGENGTDISPHAASY